MDKIFLMSVALLKCSPKAIYINPSLVRVDELTQSVVNGVVNISEQRLHLIIGHEAEDMETVLGKLKAV